MQQNFKTVNKHRHRQNKINGVWQGTSVCLSHFFVLVFYDMIYTSLCYRMRLKSTTNISC